MNEVREMELPENFNPDEKDPMLAELEGSGNDSSTQSSVPELLDEENKEFIEEIEEKQELNDSYQESVRQAKTRQE